MLNGELVIVAADVGTEVVSVIGTNGPPVAQHTGPPLIPL